MNRSGVSGIKRSANKDLDALDDRTYIRIDRNIQRLINDPFSRGVKKLTDDENRYRIRVGKYSKELGFLKNDEIHGSIVRIRKMLLGLIKHLKGKNG